MVLPPVLFAELDPAVVTENTVRKTEVTLHLTTQDGHEWETMVHNSEIIEVHRLGQVI